MVEQITSDQVIKWLRAKQPAFTEVLMGFGRKYDRGFEWGHRKSKYHGEFTGVKLCDIAVSIIEEALRRKYGEATETAPRAFSTCCMDPETLSVKDLASHPHHNLLFRVTEETDWYVADPTYRQFQIRVNPYKMLIGIPAKNQDRLYSIRSTPVSIKPGYLYSQHLLLSPRDFDGISLVDYQKLLEPFLN